MKQKSGDQKIGRRLQLARKRAGLSQFDLAERIGVSHGMISHYETGRSAIPPEKVPKICEVLNISADWLLRGVGPEPGSVDYLDIYERMESIERRLEMLAHERQRAQHYPVFRRIPAGPLDEVTQTPDAVITLPPSDAVILFEVRGESMIEAGITPGSIIMVRPRQQVASGAIAAVEVDGKLTVKRVKYEKDHIRLIPANGKMPEIQARENVRIIGEVIWVIHRPK
jgi:SOS-response transcriptional repressor LexA